MPDSQETTQEMQARIEALLAEGVRQQQAENFEAAQRAYRAVLQLDPTQPQALALLGMIAGMFGELQTAIDLFLQALKRDPNNADLYHNLGETYRHLNDPAKALPCFVRAVELRPEHLLAYRSAADTALAAIETASKPEHATELARLAVEHLRLLGLALHRQKHPETLPVLREALEINPADAETLWRLGAVLNDYGLPHESLDFLKRAAMLRPDSADIQCDLGTTLYALRRWQETDDAFAKALALNPAHKIARVNRVTCALMHGLYEDAPTPEEIFEQHRAWGRSITAELAPVAAAEAAPFPNTPDPERRLRIGFVSGDFRDHPVGQFFRTLLAHHDRSAFDFYCYTEQERTDGFTQQLQQTGGIWRLASATASDAALRTQLRNDQIDVAIDLSGQTAGNRLHALAVRATPVAATWLGYPATTGLPTIDWRITDEIADPPGFERYYTEKLLRLAGGFLCYEPRIANAPDVAPLPALTRGTITFGSFNNVLKVTAQTVACWAAILRGVPGSRLVMKAGSFADPGVRSSLLEQFAQEGADISQVELRAHTPDPESHLAVYGEIDIGLDPLIYNGTTTTCEALWMGVPVVTWIGDRHAARVGFDLLSRIGLAELAAADIDGYVATALALARDLPRLGTLRRELRTRMRGSVLCDGPHFARSFEAGLREMWRVWCAEAGAKR